MAQTELTIGIIAFNTPQDESNCLESVARNVKIPYELIMVQNVQGEGHSHGVNKIVERAKTKYVVVLSADTLVSKNSIEYLLQSIHSHPKAVIVGPTTSKATPPQVIEIGNILKEKVNIDNINLLADICDITKMKEIAIDSVNGFAFIINKKLFNSVGKFPKNIPNYGNEQVFAKNIKKKKLEMYWVPNAYIHHFGERSIRKDTNYDETAYQKRRQAGDEALVKMKIQDKQVLEQYKK